jgi:four helix bundle protein
VEREDDMAFVPFENLRVFQMAETLADDIWELVIKWPPFAKDTVGKQLVRAADSVGANIAEGSGRGSKKDFGRFVRIARGSLNETRYWLKRAVKRKLIGEKEIFQIEKITKSLAPSLNAFLNSLSISDGPDTKHQTPNTKH